MVMQTEGAVDEALSNLSAIQSGEPLTDEQEPEIEFYDDVMRREKCSAGLEKKEIIDLFIEFCNIVEPEHPYVDDAYPLKLSDVESTHCKNSSSYRAKCGPRNGITYTAHFSIDRKQLKTFNIEAVYQLIVHELTHITEGRHSEGSSHNPTFWKQFARNAVTLYRAREGENNIDWNLFFTYCRENPNNPMTDKRMRTVNEQKDEVEQEIRKHL